MRFIRSFLLLVVLSAATAVQAQSVRWRPGDSPNVAILVYEECSPDGDPALPAVPGVTFTPIGRSNNANIVNFRVSRSVEYTYVVRAQRNAPVQIPSFTVKTDQGTVRVAPFTVGAPAATLESMASAKFLPERTSVWAGEVFTLNYALYVSRQNGPQPTATFDWNPAPLVVEDWTKPELSEITLNGQNRIQVLFRSRAMAKTPNTLKLEAANHTVTVQVGTRPLGALSIFQAPNYENVVVSSDQPVIEVKPLPPAPAGFTGAVGQFTLTSKVVPQKAAVGEPVTWTLELNGTGNWPDIAGVPTREVSSDFQVVQPKAKRTAPEGKLFDSTLTEDVVLVPTKPGNYTLGPLSFTYFNPKTGAYETKKVPATTVTINAPATTGQINVGSSATTSRPPEASQMEPPPPDPALERRPPPAPATPPKGIPGDPLPGMEDVAAPIGTAVLVAWLVSPIAALLALWLALAVRRARQTDPVRPRREARDRLGRTLLHLQSASESERASLLLAWQRDTKVLWQLRHAAPSAAAFRDAPDAAAWATLWAEAERALYGAQPALPADWIARAQEALVARRLSGFKPMRLFLPQNLMPFAAVLAFGFACVAAAIAAENAAKAAYSPTSAAGAYVKGDFAGAEKGWRTRISTTPTDWIARHNLSLALAQQERAGEAAGQAAAAFVQRPAQAAVRWHLGLAAEKMGATPSELAAFLTPGPLEALGGLMSPAMWQRTMIAASWIGAVVLGAWLLNGYGPRRHALNVACIVGAVLAVGGVGAAAAGVQSYGLAANADAVIVTRSTVLRSIPTEADTTQKTTPVAPGAMAIADKTFSAGAAWLSRMARPAGCGRRNSSRCGSSSEGVVSSGWRRSSE